MSDGPARDFDDHLAVKGFDKASETTILVGDSLKLFLACERRSIKNPYEEIADDEVVMLCRHPERLPPHFRNFILWQKNIVKLDAAEICETGTPKGFKFKYDVKGAKLAEIESDDERTQCIQTFLDEQETYFAKFNEVRAILEATEDRFLTIEETLSRAESLDDSLSTDAQNEKAEIEDIRKKLCDMRAVLEDDVLPDLIRFGSAPDHAKALMVQLSDINVRLRDKMRKHQSED